MHYHVLQVKFHRRQTLTAQQCQLVSLRPCTLSVSWAVVFKHKVTGTSTYADHVQHRQLPQCD